MEESLDQEQNPLLDALEAVDPKTASYLRRLGSRTLEEHCRQEHVHGLPPNQEPHLAPGFEVSPPITWEQVHRNLHRLAIKHGEAAHAARPDPEVVSENFAHLAEPPLAPQRRRDKDGGIHTYDPRWCDDLGCEPAESL